VEGDYTPKFMEELGKIRPPKNWDLGKEGIKNVHTTPPLGPQ